MIRLAPLLLLPLALIQAPALAPTSPEVGAELARHRGVWRAVSFRRGGKETAEAVVRTITRTVDGDRVVWRRDGKSFSGSTIVLDPKSDPPTIDIRADGGPARDKVVRGIYKLEGDKLTLCTSDPDEPRPTRFQADAGDRQNLQVFEREASPAKGP